ncbi:MAG: methyltransferase domain-containing protein [Myxococcales bacterium FL481]|nr:MAG: methyltransferase domain-containing protein [Myxococcales bacterium FL481]
MTRFAVWRLGLGVILCAACMTDAGRVPARPGSAGADRRPADSRSPGEPPAGTTGSAGRSGPADVDPRPADSRSPAEMPTGPTGLAGRPGSADADGPSEMPIEGTGSASSSPRVSSEPAAKLGADPGNRAIADAGADPAINSPWQSERVDPLIQRLESESREVFEHRARLITEVGARPGARVADIGAGSGLLTLMLAEAVGSAGRVYAVDINPALLDTIDRRARARELTNVETRLADQAEAPLDAASVDLVLICDTYHHFEQPQSTMASLRRALRPGGELVVVDFERIPGQTAPFFLEHVRAGKEVFRREIEAAGFDFVREHDVAELQDNYMLRFRRPGD